MWEEDNDWLKMPMKFSVIVFIIQLLIIVSVGVDVNQTKCDELLNRVQT